jgi:hypothetical protein
MQITRRSNISGKIRTKEINCTEEQLNSYYHGGKLIQEAFPELSADDREFIKTGVTSEEWDELFK